MLVGASTYNLCLFKQTHWEVQLFLCSKKVAWRYFWKLDQLSLAGIFVKMWDKIPGLKFPEHIFGSFLIIPGTRNYKFISIGDSNYSTVAVYGPAVVHTQPGVCIMIKNPVFYFKQIHSFCFSTFFNYCFSVDFFGS